MQGKELQLATDPNCSGILERMVYSMDDLVRRLFIENYLGSYVSSLTGKCDTECPLLQIPSIDYSSIRLACDTDIPHRFCRHHYTRNSGHLPCSTGLDSISEPPIIDRFSSRDMRSKFTVVRQN